MLEQNSSNQAAGIHANPVVAAVEFGDTPARGLTVAQYADAKNLPEGFLRDKFKLKDRKGEIEMPYLNADGTYFRSKVRPSLDKDAYQMYWIGDKGPIKVPYGVWLIAPGKRNIMLVEGESDTQTLHHYGLAGIGISGKNGWKNEFAELQCFKDADKIYVVQEPGQGGSDFVSTLASYPLQPKLRVVKLPVKDISELHLQNPKGFLATLTAAVKDSEQATPASKKAKKYDEVFYEGGRNNGLMSVAGRLIFDGLPFDQLEAELLERNDWQCIPSLDESVVKTMAKNVVARETAKRASQSPETPAIKVVQESAETISRSAPPAIPSINAPEFPANLQGAALQGIFGEFVATALPYCESDVNCLLYQALVALGNLLGRNNYTLFGAERHYPALFAFIIGTTSAGKGQAYKTLRAFCTFMDHGVRAQVRWKYSAASGEGSPTLLSSTGKSEDEWGSKKIADERMLLMLTEVSILLNSMNREGSNTSGYIRAAYDLDPLENNKSKQQLSARNYL